jgi:hypothetical protein
MEKRGSAWHGRVFLESSRFLMRILGGLRGILIALCLAALVALLATGCTTDTFCTAGESVECTCLDGSNSAQVCADSGRAWGECQCASSPGQSGTGPGPNPMPMGDEPTEYIIGGELSRTFAATGALVSYGGSPFCTATLVTRELVLTAAHCVQRASAQSIFFVIGSDPSSPSAQSAVSRITMHRDWVGSVSYGSDLAVLRLVTPIDSVKPVVLHGGDARALVGQTMTLVGYGASASPACDGRGVDGGVRRRVSVGIDAVANQWISYAFRGSGACNGDSGGPAFVEVGGQWRQVGVTSWGDQCCVRHGNYQRLDLHRTWLSQQGVPFADRAVVCDEDGACDGQCQDDADCWNLLCPGGSCRAPGGACAADASCDPNCGSVDPDCIVNDEELEDACTHLYDNGVCDAHCVADPECEKPPGGGGPAPGGDPASPCNPTQYAPDSAGRNCVYSDAQGQICGSSPLQSVVYDTAYRTCVYIDTFGTACGWNPATFRYDPFTNICQYLDPTGMMCGIGSAWCQGFNCFC